MAMEFQDSQVVYTKMNVMKGIFDQYLRLVEAMNNTIEDNINNGNESALDSFLGADFKNAWETLYNDFIQLNNFFENKYYEVAATTENNEELNAQWALACGCNYSGSTVSSTSKKELLPPKGSGGSFVSNGSGRVNNQVNYVAQIK